MFSEETDMLHVSYATFESNTALFGGAVYTSDVRESQSALVGCVLIGNGAIDGGALYFQSQQGVDSVASSIFMENKAGTSFGH